VTRIRRTFFGSKKRRVLTTMAVLALGAVAAWAAWFREDEGPAAARGGELSALTITAGDPSSTPGYAALYPGSTGAAVVNIQNPNGGALVVTEVVSGNGITADNGCNAASITVNPHVLATPVPVPSGNNTNVQIPNAIAMSNAANTSCQNSNVSVGNLRLKFSTP
jgi:hypothetical protein